jgi:hypothetical protein
MVLYQRNLRDYTKWRMLNSARLLMVSNTFSHKIEQKIVNQAIDLDAEKRDWDNESTDDIKKVFGHVKIAWDESS